MIYVIMILIKVACNKYMRKIGKYKEWTSSMRPTLHLSSQDLFMHLRGGASTSVRGNVLFNVTLDIVGCNVVVKSHFEFCQHADFSLATQFSSIPLR